MSCIPLTPTIWMLRPGALGDTLLTIPAFLAIKNWQPDLFRVLVINSRLITLPWVESGIADQVIEYEHPKVFETLFRPSALNLQDFPQIIVVWKPQKNLTIESHIKRWSSYGGVILELSALTNMTQAPPHAAERMGQGIPGWNWSEYVRTSPPFLLELRFNSDQIGLVPGAGSVTKYVPIPFWQKLADMLTRHQWEPVWIWGPSENERMQYDPATQALWQMITARNEVIDNTENINQLFSRVTHLHAMIATDTGPAHLAASVGILTFPVYTSTSPKVWLPLGSAYPVQFHDYLDAPEQTINFILEKISA